MLQAMTKKNSWMIPAFLLAIPMTAALAEEKKTTSPVDTANSTEIKATALHFTNLNPSGGNDQKGGFGGKVSADIALWKPASESTKVPKLKLEAGTIPRSGWAGAIGGVSLGVDPIDDQSTVMASTTLSCGSLVCTAGTLLGGQIAVGKSGSVQIQGRIPYFAMVVDKNNGMATGTGMGGLRVGVSKKIADLIRIKGYLDGQLSHETAEGGPGVNLGSKFQDGMGVLLQGGVEAQIKANEHITLGASLAAESYRYKYLTGSYPENENHVKVNAAGITSGISASGSF
jgi:hypothetical protein